MGDASVKADRGTRNSGRTRYARNVSDKHHHGEWRKVLQGAQVRAICPVHPGNVKALEVQSQSIIDPSFNIVEPRRVR